MLTLVPAGDDRAAVVSRLLQLYAYDLSDLLELDVGADGVFALPFPDRYWIDGRYHAFLIEEDGKVAGFAIVDSRSRFSEDETWDMNQFFVLRRYRRRGVGRWAAVELFTRFPGRWEVREAARNTPARDFWRRVIGDFSGGTFDETSYDDARWRGYVQRFDSR
jgi:predicted acetyltransferase